ncbi:ATP-dependent DNA helicase RecG [Trueperella pyogenes]|uniref:ATP-dependent DNA helicase RecG n=1 Tax=Trueperella pyogenes TaxID=1661 RepID=UPI000F852098|nr:ATP-dependent DNA helicase RecG [Trueperella pyogenes]AZR01892.1 ATP-dependent DNA helicase RecG [Trueperella pyogenes]
MFEGTATTAESWTALARPLDRVLGPRSAAALSKLGLVTVGDLLNHVPFRLARRGELLPIEAVRDGDSVTVVARVIDSQVRPMHARRGFILSVVISDGEHTLDLAFFAKSSRPLHFHAAKLRPGTLATFSGTISSYRGQLQLSHPEYEVVDNEAEVDPGKIAQPIPIYHAAAKMPSWKIEKAVAVALASLTTADVPEPLPAEYLAVHGLPGRFDALKMAHQPNSDEEWYAALKRCKHEEAFVLQALLAQRASAAISHPAPALRQRSDGILANFDSRLPFSLTVGQRSVGQELAGELAGSIPMRRLLQGDVGSGKTVVALRAMLQAVDAGRQAVLVAPTEVLASQHFVSFQKMLGELGRAGQLLAAEQATSIELLTGSLSAAKKRQALANIASGAAGIIVGTHALFEEHVQIPFLGLVVIDEQHRFGVDQRDRLAEGAHLLVMTATPIPRTIAMTSFGELQVSTLRELPAGRRKIATNLVPALNKRWTERVWERAREEIDASGRVYVVCPRISATIEEDLASGEPNLAEQLALDSFEPTSVEGALDELRTKPVLAGIELGYVHGRLDADAKAQAMADFASGRTPLLVSTTVIEVGVDVPEATMMVILDAERFGLSQLHQLRGRVGRGERESLCLAIHHCADGTLAYERLKAFAATSDGFALAEKDLELRSEGNVLGAAQSGRSSSLKFVRVREDEAIIASARQAARELVAVDPDLAAHPALRAAIEAVSSESTDYLEKT